jgi:D-hexose-6-phosphate mutarotase
MAQHGFARTSTWDFIGADAKSYEYCIIAQV